MLRTRLLTAAALALTLGACDSLNELFATDGDVAHVLDVSELTGKAVEFSSSENAAQGGHGRWQYSFVASGRLVGCNDVTSYQADDWFPAGDNAVRVTFGAHWEEYEFTSGSWSSGGSFRLTTSLGTAASGTFREVSGLSLGGCP